MGNQVIQTFELFFCHSEIQLLTFLLRKIALILFLKSPNNLSIGV